MNSFKIKIFTADGVQSMGVPKAHFTIGSASHCEVRLQGESIAPEHMRVWVDGGHLWGQDLGSNEGTSMNGQPLQSLRPLLFRETDVFKLGSSGASLAFQSASSSSHGVRSPVTVMTAPISSTEENSEEFESSVKFSEKSFRKIEADNLRLHREIEELRKQVRRVSASPDDEKEISQVKKNALLEIKAMKAAESRRFETLKRESVEEVERIVLSLIESRPKNKRVGGLKQDVSLALRQALLGDRAAQAEVRERMIPTDHLLRVVIPLFAAGILCFGYVFYTKSHVGRQLSSVSNLSSYERANSSKSSDLKSSLKKPSH
jgi:pSer/pThr/pTyr-binding forkhead associated (FHA) protein